MAAEMSRAQRVRLAFRRRRPTIGCDSADGTFLAFGPTKNLPRLLGWLEALESEAA